MHGCAGVLGLALGLPVLFLCFALGAADPALTPLSWIIPPTVSVVRDHVNQDVLLSTFVSALAAGVRCRLRLPETEAAQTTSFKPRPSLVVNSGRVRHAIQSNRHDKGKGTL